MKVFVSSKSKKNIWVLCDHLQAFEKCEGAVADDKQQLDSRNHGSYFIFLPNRRKMFLSFDICIAQEGWRAQAETRPSMRHNYTCSAKHEAVLYLRAPGAGPTRPSILLRPASSFLLNIKPLSRIWDKDYCRRLKGTLTSFGPMFGFFFLFSIFSAACDCVLTENSWTCQIVLIRHLECSLHRHVR